ncbi:hypothetical protein ACJRO7_034899 [Eucalyptus globulus]|uniref:Uncharacterized protein n=1 Tax=Eucalyptus globulus TaxID=34317 RepID=A0ABD3J4B1_EUCGL
MARSGYLAGVPVVEAVKDIPSDLLRPSNDDRSSRDLSRGDPFSPDRREVMVFLDKDGLSVGRIPDGLSFTAGVTFPAGNWDRRSLSSTEYRVGFSYSI